MVTKLRHLTALLAAALLTGALASAVQTQVSLSALLALGAPLTTPLWLITTLQDVATFGPVMTGIALVALLLAFTVAHLLLRLTRIQARTALLSLAAVAGLATAFALMRWVIPMPALPGTRGMPGYALMSLCALPAGLLYARMTSPVRLAARAQRGLSAWREGAAAGVLALIPAALFAIAAPRAGAKPEPVDPASYAVQTVASGLNRPWSVAFLPDGRVLVTEMAGRLRTIARDGSTGDIALTGLPPIFHQGGVSGLMEVALDPDFASNARIYLTMGYGEPRANGTRLVSARLVHDRLEDVRVLFSATSKSTAGNNGGRLAFLGDGTLVLTVGDGNAQREQAQNRANHLGTVVRLTHDGQVPHDNPYAQRAGAAREIYSLGHRNAQGIAVDPENGELLVTEHGARGGDEVNRVVAGGNYGWPLITGGIDYPFARITPFQTLAGYQDPILDWTPSIAPAGLAIYRGALFPEWRGDLLVPALKERAVRRVMRDGQRITGEQLLLSELGERMRDVKVAPDGAIYVLTDGVDARLLRVTPAAAK